MRNSILCQKRISLQLYIGEIIVRNREHFIHKSHRKQFFGLTHPTAADLPSISIANTMHSEDSLFPNKHLWPLLLFFWLKWAGYLAVAGLNLLAQISDRISPFGV